MERRRNSRNAAFILDMFHIIIGIAVVVLAVLSFLNPEGNILLFPVIFLLAAVLNGVNGFCRVRVITLTREKKKKAGGFLMMGFGAVLLALSVVSMISIWWR